MKYLWIIAAVVALVVGSCRNTDDGSSTPEYRLTVGDTVVTIPPAAVDFARTQFSIHAYLLREFQVARDPAYHQEGAPFTGSLLEWKALGWATRWTFLNFPSSPYAHDVETGDPAEYYYEIGTYFSQFGYGWRDTFDPEANLNDPSYIIWLHPADSTLAPDNTGTIGFDGGCRFIGQYRNMWTLQY